MNYNPRTCLSSNKSMRIIYDTLSKYGAIETPYSVIRSCCFFFLIEVYAGTTCYKVDFRAAASQLHAPALGPYKLLFEIKSRKHGRSKIYVDRLVNKLENEV